MRQLQVKMNRSCALNLNSKYSYACSVCKINEPKYK